MITMPIELYTDGSSLKNPGPSGLAYIIRYYDLKDPNSNQMPEPQEIVGNQGFRLSTNNRMEIMAAIYGIKVIIEKVESGMFHGATQISIMSDSEYFVNAINFNWIGKWQKNNWMTAGYQGSKPQQVKNKDLWEQIIQLQNKLRLMNINLTLTHVKGHNGNEFNERVDKMAVEASKNQAFHIQDEGYEHSYSPSKYQNGYNSYNK